MYGHSCPIVKITYPACSISQLHKNLLSYYITIEKIDKSKSKGKLSRYSHAGAKEQRRYSSYSFTTSALDGDERLASRPGRALAPGKGPPVPIVQEAGWASEPVWTQRIEEKSFASAGDRTPVVQHGSIYVL
jgi:hypothetical protein